MGGRKEDPPVSPGIFATDLALLCAPPALPVIGGLWVRHWFNCWAWTGFWPSLTSTHSAGWRLVVGESGSLLGCMV